MYPTIEFFSIQIYTFGIVLSVTWILFFSLLHRFSIKGGVIRPIFSDIFTFTISILFFSRIFHILTDWVNEKFILESLVHGEIIEFLKLFFIPPNYLFSLFGGVFGFTLVFLLKTRSNKAERTKYIEPIVFAFLAASTLGYIGAFLGGQVYGIPFNSFISVLYTHADSIVKDSVPLFPLAIFYSIFCGVTLVTLKYFSKKQSFPAGFLGLIGLGVFSLFVFFGEFLSGTHVDIFYDLVIRITHGFFGLSLNQIGSLFGIGFSITGIFKIAGQHDHTL